MTSARSRLLRLNGSSLLAGALILYLAACGTARKTADTPPPETSVPKVYNPVTGQYEALEDPVATIDTVSWETVDAPVITSEPETRRKGRYDISLLIPFCVNENPVFYDRIPAKTRRFLHYYSGMKLALEDLEQEGVRLNIKVYDTRESAEVVDDLLRGARNADMVIGPYERSNILAAAEFGRRYQVPVISPWTPSISPSFNASHLVQITPGLHAHAQAAMAYTTKNMSSAKFFIVATPTNQDDKRMKLYEDAYNTYSTSHEPMEKLVITDVTADLNEMEIRNFIDSTRANVFVMPYYLRQEEDFVNAFLRKLHAERKENVFYIVGLPQWENFRKIDSDYLQALNALITTAHYKDVSSEEVAEFDARFFSQYLTIAEPAAWQGYELLMYLGRNMNRYGSRFLDRLINADNSSGDPFEIVPIYGIEARAERNNPIQYFENRNMHILQFTNQRFRKIQ